MEIFSNISSKNYAGTQRVSSKIGTTENLGDFLQDWFTQGTGGPVDVIGSSFGVLENAEQGVVQVYNELGIDPPTYESDPVFIPVASFIHGGNEIEQYFFHPDHLGSTSYITNLLGEVSQHMEYFAFGETFVEEHRSSNNSPYKFNGKELDEETGWYYYGARYYDPRISVWLSVDPLAEQTMTPYQYTYQNPIRFIDPTGMSGEDSDGWGWDKKRGVVEYSENITADNYKNLGYDDYCDSCNFGSTPNDMYHLGVDGSVSSTRSYGPAVNDVINIETNYDTRYDISTLSGTTIKGKGNGIFPRDPGSITDLHKARSQFYQWNNPGARIAVGVGQGFAEAPFVIVPELAASKLSGLFGATSPYSKYGFQALNHIDDAKGVSGLYIFDDATRGMLPYVGKSNSSIATRLFSHYNDGRIGGQIF